MPTYRTARSHLIRCIALAELLENQIGSTSLHKKSTIVGFGFLVRLRRLAEAVLKLGKDHAYEAQILLRSMIEIHYNHKWILLSAKERRANRFIKFEVLERLKISNNLSESMDPNEYAAGSKKLKAMCAKVRHLFRLHNKKGKLVWAKSWASVTSFESRLMKVLNKPKTKKLDKFLYALYRSFSSTVHGGPMSIYQVLESSPTIRAKLQPESEPEKQIRGAFLILLDSIRTLAENTSMIGNLEPELPKLEKIAYRHG